MSNRLLSRLLLCITLIAFGLIGPAAAQTADKPNILVIWTATILCLT